jgi:uncharacterized delta-60 repeat protein
MRRFAYAWLMVAFLAFPSLLVLAFSAAAGPTPPSAEKASETRQESVDVERALAITRGGRPLVVGVSRKGSRRTWALARYRANGSLDLSFGAGGRVLTLIPPGQLEPYGPLAVAIQADGKVVVVGGGGFRLARYTVRGRLDPSFGRKGRVLTDFSSVGGSGPSSIASAVAVAPDGKVVAAGSSGNNFARFALARYTARGQLDQSFGQGGKVVLGNRAAATAIAVEPDGKIVALGFLGQPMGPPAVVMLRFTAAGELDPSFGQGGQVLVDPLNEVSSTFLVQPDGKIVVAGLSGLAGTDAVRARLLRYTAEGRLDPSFGTDGEVVVGDRPESLSALALEGDGKLVVAGLILPNPSVGCPCTFLLARYTQNGSLDPGFGQGGTVLTMLPLGAAAIEGDGKIVTAATSQEDFLVARYMSGGGIDPSFGSGGRVITAFGPAWRTWLASLSAERARSGVLVRWRTAAEFDLRGFGVYRQQNGVRRLANRGLIRAKGAGLSASYVFRDRRATHSTQRYWLQEVTIDGNFRWFGPIKVTR